MRIVRSYKKLASSALLLTGAALLFTSTPRLQGSEFACEIIGINKSAWIVRGDSGVKITPVKVGDVLYFGDTLTVVHGNSVDLAFDAQKGNVFHVKGQTDVRITKGLARQLEMKQGQVVAFLDNPTADRNFKVVTPTAVAAVRGTRFSVQALPGGATQVATYQGSVQVRAKDGDGKEKKDYVLLRADNKTLVDPSEDKPLETLPLAPGDSRLYQNAKTSIEQAVAAVGGSSAFDAATDGRVERVTVEEDPAKLKSFI